MKGTVSVQSLRRAVADLRISQIPVGDESSVPGDGALRVEMERDSLVLSTCTSQVASSTTLEATDVTRGSLTVVATSFARLVDAAYSDEITLGLDPDQGGLRAEARALSVQLPAYKDDPWVGPTLDPELAQTSAKGLREVRRVLFACDPKSGIRGVLLGAGIAVATDKHRLAEVELDVDFEPAVVPRQLLDHVLDLQADECVARLDRRWIQFGSRESRWSSALLHDAFPPYTEIFEREPVGEIVADRGQLMSALGRMQKVIGDVQSRAVFLRGSENRDGRVWAFEHERGFALEELDLKASFEQSMCFNARYLIHVLHALRERTVTFEVLGRLAPVLIREAGFRSILMPIRTAETED